MQDQQSIVIDQFRGLFDRGETRDLNVTQIEPGFFKTLDNFYHQGESLVSRPGFDLESDMHTDPTLAGKKLRIWPYRNASGALKWLVLIDAGATYTIGDNGGASAVVYTLSGLNDFQFYILRDKAFGGEIALNLVGGGILGIGNTKIYKLDQNPAHFRDAAGLSPSAGAGITAATSATAGVVEPGVHLIAVAYETDTGFITPPGVFVGGVYTPTQYTAPGNFKIDLSVIPTGPAGTAKRHILASKVVRPPFNGDVLVPELFFVPGGTINDNVTTTLTVDFYDTALVESADYLLDELEAIPAGTSYCLYNNRLVIVGFAPAAPPGFKPTSTAASYVARVSNVGQYESFSSIEGWIQVVLDDGGPLQACFELNGNLYLCKTNRTYVTRDNGGPPNTWPVSQIDSSIGCGPFGLARLDETQNSIVEGGVIIGATRGIYYFTGQYASDPLTYNIDSLYRRDINAVVGNFAAYNSKLFYDSYRKILYWLPSPTSGTKGSDFMLVGSCDNGLSPEKIRWSRFDAFNSNDGSVPNRRIRDIYTCDQFKFGVSTDKMLYMVFDNGANTADTNDLWRMRPIISFDAQDNNTLVGGIIDWELVAFPANVEELDKLQAIVTRVLAKHDNNEDPIDFELGAFDFTYNEFTPTLPQFFGDPRLRDMVLLPQLYDAPIDLRSKLIGIAFNRGVRGGSINGVSLGTVTNSVYIHKMMLFGNKAAEDKLRGSIR